MEQGIIKKTFTDRNIGFISSDGDDIFFHKTVVKGTVSFEELQEGQGVEFESEDGPMGPKATVVRAADGEGQTVENESEDSPEGSQDVAERAIDRIEAQTAEHESEDDTSTNRTVKYVVAVFDLESTYQKKKNFKKHFIWYFSKDKFDLIEAGTQSLPKRFINRLTCYEPIACDTELDAWKTMVDLKEQLGCQEKEVSLDMGKKDCQLYILKMDQSVRDNSIFKKMNASLSNREKVTCVYVGQTNKTPKYRFRQHLREIDGHPAKLAKYFLPSFEEAYHTELLDEYRITGRPTKGLTRYEALKEELALREWIQKKDKFAAYSN